MPLVLEQGSRVTELSPGRFHQRDGELKDRSMELRRVYSETSCTLIDELPVGYLRLSTVRR
jgi:hypothetical protein